MIYPDINNIFTIKLLYYPHQPSPAGRGALLPVNFIIFLVFILCLRFLLFPPNCSFFTWLIHFIMFYIFIYFTSNVETYHIRFMFFIIKKLLKWTISFSYRVTHKGWDFRDDYTKFTLSVSYIHNFLQLETEHAI